MIAGMSIGQILFAIVLLIALVIAILAFVKSLVTGRGEETRGQGMEYAPMYSKKEHFIRVAKNVTILVPAYLVIEFWFKPKLSEFSEYAHCINYGPINGTHLIFYGVFVGVPLFVAILFMLTAGVRAIRVFRIGQDPLPGEKVERLTRYKYGFEAKRNAINVFVAISCFVGLSIWGGFQAYRLTKAIPVCEVEESSGYEH